MPSALVPLDPQAQKFIREVIAGASHMDAARLAGFPESSAKEAAARLLRRPDVSAAIFMEVRRALVADGVVARRVLLDIASNKRALDKDRLAAARVLLGRAGHIEPRATEQKDAIEKPLNELSTRDLRQLAEQLEGELASRAKVVSAPIEHEDNASHYDLIG